MKDLATLTSWHSDWKGLRVVVFGLGVSGFSVADTLAELGCEVMVIAEKAEADLLDILDVIGVPHVTGVDQVELLAAAKAHAPHLMVTSPGVQPENEILVWCERAQVPIWVDIDVAWRLRDKTSRVAKWIAITGTNGKTTTVQMVEAMLNAGGIRAIACGNIGTPILDVVRDELGYDALVVELSSFQLHYLGKIQPMVSAVLNLADDHLDWHGDFEKYRDVKGKIYENTEVACVYNINDPVTEQLVENADVIEGARAIGFTTGMPGRSQVGFVEEILCDRAFLDDRANSALELATLHDLAQIGVLTPHLMANTAAAAAIARACGVQPAEIKSAIANFRLDAHRIELVAERDEIRWIDDSKATNPHATAASLNSFEHVVWIVGGLLKGVDINGLVAEYADRLAAAIVIGKDREAVVAALAAHAPNVQVFEITNQENSAVMSEAVAKAAEVAVAGDVVLLAPAAASMDQFKDYADRGNQFARAVKTYLGEI